MNNRRRPTAKQTDLSWLFTPMSRQTKQQKQKSTILILLATVVICICFSCFIAQSGVKPTATKQAVEAPTSTVETVLDVEPTSTRKSLPPTWTLEATTRPTFTPGVTQKPASTQKAATGCDCSVDYDCKDFTTHRAAQTCFELCGGSATNNWSRLDGNDHDGNVCESLP